MGTTYVFTRRTEGPFYQHDALIPTEFGSEMLFGQAIAAHGAQLMVSAPGVGDSGQVTTYSLPRPICIENDSCSCLDGANGGLCTSRQADGDACQNVENQSVSEDSGGLCQNETCTRLPYQKPTYSFVGNQDRRELEPGGSRVAGTRDDCQ